LEVLSRILAEIVHMSSSESVEVSCHSCKNFYITWEKEFPYGCRAMDFKSIRLPSREVSDADGQECLAYEHKHIHYKHKKEGMGKALAKQMRAKASKLNIQV
jgi:hypothetical protein